MLVHTVCVNSLWKTAWLLECLLPLYPFCPCECEGGKEGCCEWGACEGCWTACCWGGVWFGVGGRGAGVIAWACGDAVWRRPSLWPPCSGSMPEPDTGRTTEHIRLKLHEMFKSSYFVLSVCLADWVSKYLIYHLPKTMHSGKHIF